MRRAVTCALLWHRSNFVRTPIEQSRWVVHAFSRVCGWVYKIDSSIMSCGVGRPCRYLAEFVCQLKKITAKAANILNLENNN